jgi:hypothetical protein
VNSSQIYPQLTNGEAAVAHAAQAAKIIEQTIPVNEDLQQAITI